MEEYKKIIKMGNKKIIIVPKKIDWAIGDYVELKKVMRKNG